MRVVLLTSTHLRHLHAVSYFASRFDLLGAWLEEKSFRPEDVGKSPEDREVISEHFEERRRSEEEFMGGADEEVADVGIPVHRTPPGGVNDPVEIQTMYDLAPDVVLVFGTGILKEPIIERFSGSLLNIHLGLSPYYRGSGTNFWPLVNGEPEYVGATIHFIDPGIDTGPMVAHSRPKIEPGDLSHDIGNRAIISGLQTLGDAAELHVARGVRQVEQQGEGKLYFRKDFNASAVRSLRANFARGMIEEYLANRERRSSAVDLVRLRAADE